MVYGLSWRLTMYNNKYNQHGGVLLIALIIVAVVSILSGSILYMLKTNVVQNQAIENYNNSRNSAFLSLKSTLEANDYIYTNTPVLSSVKNYSSGNSNITVTSTVQSDLNDAIFPDSVALNNASAVLQYHVNMQVTAQTQHQAKYVAIVNAPSQYYQENDLSPQDTQNVNIPSIILNNLDLAQKSSSETIENGNAGFLGALEIDNSGSVSGSGKQINYTLKGTVNTYSLKFKDNGNYLLEQGWYLEDGDWNLGILIYDKNTGVVWQTSIGLTQLENLSTNDTFSTLDWTQILGTTTYNPALAYVLPDYVIFDGQKFMALDDIDPGDNPYEKPKDWRVIIAPLSFPQFNANIEYYAGDIVTDDGDKYVAESDINSNKDSPAAGGKDWVIVPTTTGSPWVSQKYNPGEVVTYGGFTFVNIKKSNKKKNPFEQSKNWRIIPQNFQAIPYLDDIYYTEGLVVMDDNKYFVNIKGSDGKSPPNSGSNNNWYEISEPNSILGAKLISKSDQIYSFIVKQFSSGKIEGEIYNDVGASTSIAHDYGVVQDVSKVYLLATDQLQSQNTDQVILFFSTSSGLKRIVVSNISSTPEITSGTILLGIASPIDPIQYAPQIIPDSTTENFLVLPYASSVDIYKYTPATPSLTFLRTVSFSNQIVKQVLPFKGFIIVITKNDPYSPEARDAHFIALSVDKEFASIDLMELSSVDGVYLTYDPATQKTFLKTATDSTGVEIQDAPMPYGVIGMQSTQ